MSLNPKRPPETPTPKCDVWSVPWTEVKADTWYVPRIHARFLERQLTHLTAQLEEARRRIGELEQQRSEWRAENAGLREQTGAIRLAVDEVGQHISDDQGFILDAKVSECVCCQKKAPTSSEIAHEIGCFTKAWQDLLAALSPKQKER